MKFFPENSYHIYNQENNREQPGLTSPSDPCRQPLTFR